MDINQILDHDAEFRYRLLSRLKSDCEYYLNYGNRCPKHLWADNEKEHISYMKALWDSFSNDKKPEWLSYDQIMDYEKKMVFEMDFLSARIEDAAARVAGKADLLATLAQQYSEFGYLDEFEGYSVQALNVDIVGCLNEILTPQNAEKMAKFVLQHLHHFTSYCSKENNTKALLDMEQLMSYIDSTYGQTFDTQLRRNFHQLAYSGLSSFVKENTKEEISR